MSEPARAHPPAPATPKAAPPRLGPEDEGPPPVRPDVQKAFWLRGDLAAAFSALLVERRRARPTTTERELLNEAVTKLVDARSYDDGWQAGYTKGRAHDR